MDDPYSFTLALNLNLILLAIPVAVIINLLVMIVLLIGAAFISAAEVSLFSLEPSHIAQIKESKSKSDDIVFKLLSNSKRLIATLLISINLANIGIVIITSYLINDAKLIDFSGNPFMGFLFQVVFLTFVILIFGEVIPKIYASRNPLKIASRAAFIIFILQKIFYPLSSLMMLSTKFIDRFKPKGHQISVEELEHALELTSNQDVSDNEHKLLKGIVKFGNTDVKQILTPRVDVVGLDKSLSFKEVCELIMESGFSRIPVYDESLDNILGIMVTKDLLKYLDSSETFDWVTLARPAYFVPESKKIDDLMKEFQKRKIHMALVVDEYGGTSGIVTLEDIIEEIVGDINDEFDEEETLFSKLDDNNFVFEGKTSLNDFYRIAEIDGEAFEGVKGEADTVAGLLIEIKGKIPRKGEKLKFNEVQFVVEAADKRRVKRVKVSIERNDVIVDA